MKNYVVISAICLLGLSSTFTVKAHDKEYDALLKAVEQSSDEASIKGLLKRAILTEAQKKELIKRAKDAVEGAEQSLVLLKSPWDFAALGAGTGLFSLGLCCVGMWYTNKRKNLAHEARLAGGAGAVAAIFGAYGAVKGFTCSAARDRYKDVETIEDLVKEFCAVAKDKTS